MATTADHLRTTLDGRWREVRERVRGELNDERFAPHYTPNTAIARSKALEQMRVLADLGYAANGFAVSHGGTGDAGGAVTSIEMLAMSDLSLMVKAGVQWGLFGGAIENLGTERHHQAYVKPLIDLDLLGCFAMTETGHGSDVQELETTATYDVETGEFVVNSPTPSSRKDYIGGAAQHATVAAVFAQLITGGESQGVHCFVVPIRDDAGNDLPGVTTSDCGLKGGLPGVDNGRIVFDQVRIPRENLTQPLRRRRRGRHVQFGYREPEPSFLHDGRHTGSWTCHRRWFRGSGRPRRIGHRRSIRPAAQAVQCSEE